MKAVVVGTRAELLRLAPVLSRMKSYCLILTGQNTVNLQGLARPTETVEINGFGGTTSILKGCWEFLSVRLQLRREIARLKPDAVLYQGDTISALLAAMAARKEGVKGIHIEAGFRSMNIWQPFPEELARRGADSRSDILFAPSGRALANLKSNRGEKHLSGSTVWDNVLQFLPNFTPMRKRFVVMTAHRYENILVKSRLRRLVEIANLPRMPLFWPMHEMTKLRMKRMGVWPQVEALGISEMVDYEEFLRRVSECSYVITDGGALEEEASILRKRCVLLRNVTERPELASTLVGLNKTSAKTAIKEADSSDSDLPKAPHPYFFGRSPSEIISEIVRD